MKENKILTAKEFFEEELSGEPLTQDSVIEGLIMFAKMHVQRSLESAIDCEIDGCGCGEAQYISNHINSILNTYPEENIK
jgi:hypothetical protein